VPPVNFYVVLALCVMLSIAKLVIVALLDERRKLRKERDEAEEVAAQAFELHEREHRALLACLDRLEELDDTGEETMRILVAREWCPEEWN
jgi:hypothetical protein